MRSVYIQLAIGSLLAPTRLKPPLAYRVFCKAWHVFWRLRRSPRSTPNKKLLSAQEARALSQSELSRGIACILSRFSVSTFLAEFIANFATRGPEDRPRALRMWRRAVLAVFCLAACALASRQRAETCNFVEVPDGVRFVM